jgi:hypothetical protein
MIKRPKEKDQMIQRPKEKDQMIQSVLFLWPLYHLSFSFGLCIICPFLLAFISSVLFFWPLYHQKKRTDDTKAKGKGQMI